MKTSTAFASLMSGLLLATTAMAQAPSSAPAGTTGLCKDGSFWSGPTKKGACHGHKGVQTWYAASGAAAGTAAAPAPSAAPPAAAPAPTPAAAPAAKKAAPAPSATAAPGGGPGLVWVNTPSHVYHCSGDRWYGKTKTGAYMTEAAAKAEGDHADHGKACQ
jgi:pyruvate/2-oxoglutarate dehydrogenase complex dihydrolipoamide acyltransferase (E2) component